MMVRISLLLPDRTNEYQQMLQSELLHAAARSGHELVPAQFADGMAMRQGEQLSALLRRDPRPDVIMMTLVTADLVRPAIEMTLGMGVGMVFLNRIPPYFEALREAYPKVLVVAVTPDQRGIGRLQATRCLALSPPHGFVLLVTGSAKTSSAIERRAGFCDEIGMRREYDEVDGQWSTDLAQRATRNWLRLPANRERYVHVVVCQNDHMAVGVSQAFRGGERPVPILIGCDGLPSVGQAMVKRGELAATVVMPSTSTVALEVIEAFTKGLPFPAIKVLESTPFP